MSSFEDDCYAEQLHNKARQECDGYDYPDDKEITPEELEALKEHRRENPKVVTHTDVPKTFEEAVQEESLRVKREATMRRLSVPTEDDIEWLKSYLRVKDEEELNQSEAIYGFCGWLSTRSKTVILDSFSDATEIAELIKLFCDVHNLPIARPNWTKRLKRVVE